MGGIKRRKSLKRLGRRQKAFDEHGAMPRANPGKAEGGTPMRMKRPGSNTRR